MRLIPTARAIIIQNNTILFVSTNNIAWHTAGGWLDNDESLIECVEREVMEEVGLLVKAKKLLFISEYLENKDSNPFKEDIHKIEHYFLCDVIKGELDDKWQDSDNGVIQYRRFFSEEEINSGNYAIYPEFLRNISFAEYTAMQDVYKGYTKR